MIEIQCRRCELVKSEDDFALCKSSANGRQYECRACTKIRMKVWYQSLTPEQKREKRRYQKQHRDENKEMYYWVRIESHYKLTQQDFEAILAAQDGGCAICGSPEPGGRWAQWSVDHDHACCSGIKSCGECVRGILCYMCNQGLGSFKDSVVSLRRAADYLDVHD